MVRPTSHPEHGMSIRMITKPMANRLKNAPSSAARLSGKDIGNIDSTVSAPNTKPHRFAKAKRDIFSSLECLMPETSQFQRSAITGSASAKIAFAFDFQENNRCILDYFSLPGPAKARPGFAVVCSPSLRTCTPLTKTCFIPAAYCCGLSNVARSAIVAGSKTTTSANIPS